MKRFLMIVLVLLIGFFETGQRVNAAGESERIKFNVTVLTEDTTREILSETIIDGPPGTDFNINLNTKGFDMRSRFLTDLVEGDELLVRVDLETRRLFGQSPNALPLYEEDKQKQSWRMGLDEAVVLLPYGKNGGGATLKIEIRPERYRVSDHDMESGNLKIEFPKTLESGEISIEAKKVPHDYLIDAELLFNGKAVAKGNAASLLEEHAEIALAAGESAPEAILGRKYKASIAVDGYIRDQPLDLVSVSFGLSDEAGETIKSGKGINGLGHEFRYSLDDELGEGFELVFRVREKKK